MRQRLETNSFRLAPKNHLKARDPAAARTDFFNISAVDTRSSLLPYSQSQAETLHCLTSIRQERQMALFRKLNRLEMAAAILIAAISLGPLVPFVLGV